MTTETLYPHQSIWMFILALVLFVAGVIAFMYNFLIEYLYPPLATPSTWCTTPTHMQSSMSMNWNLVVGILLMVIAIFIILKCYVFVEDTPSDIERQIKQHEDAIVELKRKI